MLYLYNILVGLIYFMMTFSFNITDCNKSPLNDMKKSETTTQEIHTELANELMETLNKEKTHLKTINVLLGDLTKMLKDYREKRQMCKKNKDELKNLSRNKRSRRLWSKWSSWTPCSVTAGEGRMIRWRHCLKNCDGIETEMQEKVCKMPMTSSNLFGYQI